MAVPTSNFEIRSSRFSPRPSGAALVWVLLLTGFMAVVAIAFLGSSSIQNTNARLDQAETLTDELMLSARQEVLAKLREAFVVEKTGAFTGHVAATPGLLEVRRYDVPWNRGGHTGAAAFTGTKENPAPFSQPFSATYQGEPANPRHIPLFSWKAFAPRLKHLTVQGGTPSRLNPDYNPALSFNLNTPRNPFAPGACLLSGVPEDAEALVRERTGTRWSDDSFRIGTGQTSAERPVWVQWIPVHKNPAEPPGPDNPIIGRYAYWVDVENTKLHVDQPLRDLRELPHYARLIGEPDRVEGGGSWHEQGDGSSKRQLRLALESSLPALEKNSSGPRNRGGQDGIGFAPGAAAEARHAWLGWVDGQLPLAANAAVVDWSFFQAPWPRGFEDLAIGPDLRESFRQWRNSPREKPVHPWFLRRALPQDATAEDRARAELLTQAAASGLTLFGHEEDLDPLGRPKLSLTEFQLAATSGRSAPVSVAIIQSSLLWSRLTDSAYCAAYFPGLIPTRGAPRSLADSFNRFAGTGNAGGTQNGRAALLQMLVNVAESAQPDIVPPVIDRSRGIVGARSMPYVAEVTTRARSALWLLPEDVRNDTARLLETDSSGRYAFKHPYQGVDRHLRFYATSVVLDLCIGFINPNPFETGDFQGEIEVEVDWGSLSSGAFVQRGWLKAPISGRYTPTPEPGKDPKKMHALGQCARIELGVVPASFLNDDNRASVLRIKGWRILRGGQVWHEVPVPAPGQSTARPWWEMTRSGNNLGSPEDEYSLEAYRAGGYRAAGWFTKATVESLIPDTLFVSPSWTSDTAPVSEEVRSSVEFWERHTRKAAVLERLASLDPVLGHRTGSNSPAGLFGRGHFYGALGHTWRHRPFGENTPAVPPEMPEGQEPVLETKSVTARPWQADFAGTGSQSVRVRQPVGGKLVTRSQNVPVPQWSTSATGPLLGGEYLTQKYLEPDPNGGDGTEEPPPEDEPDERHDPDLPGSLTGIYLCPAVDTHAPQGMTAFVDYTKVKFTVTSGTLAATFKDMDVETSGAGQIPLVDEQFTKRTDGKKGPRSLLCSAPAKRPCASVGELGFIHSGFPQTPILTGPDEGRTEFQLNSPRNGPPMRMMLDILAPPRYTDARGAPVSEGEWLAGSASATTGPRHAWGVNTLIAHDDYMALRQGGDTLRELKKEQNPAAQALHAVWSPNAQGFARRETGADGYLGKDAEDLVKKDPGHIQDRHLRPCVTLARPWSMWLGVLAGDFSPARSGDSLSWGTGNPAGLFYGPALMTWRPGNGSGANEEAWVDFLSHLPGHGRLLALGEDGRKDDKDENAGWLKGRHAADQNLAALDPGLPFYVPAHFATRMSLVPMRHFVSDLAVDFHQNNHESSWLRFKTALNPAIGGATPPGPDGDQSAAKKLSGAGFPGGWHQSGVYYHAPMALLTNQAGVSANAFTACFVVQAVRDNGKSREGIANSGPGHCDPDDEILAERWSRVILQKQSATSGAPAFHILFQDTAGR
ncbi:MAG TPA: hypothetical protein PK490_09605 [Prosthecobacter sp.]|nr:hypothetical protein [Prosthecobacter sp.]